jgi:hypothetical protein
VDVIDVHSTTIVCALLDIVANRPDIALRNKQEKPCLLIEIATPVDSNVNKNETEKLSKCTELQIAVSRMWKVRRTQIVPVAIGALGTI